MLKHKHSDPGIETTCSDVLGVSRGGHRISSNLGGSKICLRISSYEVTLYCFVSTDLHLMQDIHASLSEPLPPLSIHGFELVLVVIVSKALNPFLLPTHGVRTCQLVVELNDFRMDHDLLLIEPQDLQSLLLGGST